MKETQAFIAVRHHIVSMWCPVYFNDRQVVDIYVRHDGRGVSVYVKVVKVAGRMDSIKLKASEILALYKQTKI